MAVWPTRLPNDQGELFGLNGTSYAAAYVSGVAALVRSRFPELTAAQVVRQTHRQCTRCGAVAIEPRRRWHRGSGRRADVGHLRYGLSGTRIPACCRTGSADPEGFHPTDDRIGGHGCPARRRRADGSDRREPTEGHLVTARIALALLAIVPAAMAYPWDTPTDWWVFGVAVAVVLLAFAWWGGLFLTTAIGRRFAVWRRNHGKSGSRPSNEVTVLLRVESPDGAALPLPVLAGYVERFGIRASKVRATSVDAGGARTTWVSMTLGATDNLAALRARSPEIPLHDTAETVGRRLADQLREAGLNAAIVESARGPLVARGHEAWRAVRDDGDPAGYVAAYRIPVDDRLGARLAEVWSRTARETWTALEFGGTANSPTVAAVCAFRTSGAPAKAPLPGLQVQRGLQRPLLMALDPRSVDRLDVDAVALADGARSPRVAGLGD